MTTELSILIKQNEGLIYSIIKKYCSYYDLEDLYQVASIGIIKAYYNYKDNHNCKFSTFAYKYIFGEVYKYVNDNKSLKVNKEILSLVKRINESRTILTQKLMKDPSVKELSLFLELEEDLINDVLSYNYKIQSLYEVISEDSKNLYLCDIIPNGKDEYNIDNFYLRDEIEKLNMDERELINMRYFEDKTQSEVANYFGINQVQVSRNEQKILKKLRTNMTCSH